MPAKAFCTSLEKPFSKGKSLTNLEHGSWSQKQQGTYTVKENLNLTVFFFFLGTILEIAGKLQIIPKPNTAQTRNIQLLHSMLRYNYVNVFYKYIVIKVQKCHPDCPKQA